MPEKAKQDVLVFNVESSLLQELGERLVSRPEIALTEIVKNAYDADARVCSLNWSNETIIVKDDGHGMTLDEFKKYWMTIATSHKQKEPYSRNFKRLVSGSKGLGRFSARFLGQHLTVQTVAYYPEEKKYKQLIATFDWPSVDDTSNLKGVKIPYEISETYLNKDGIKSAFNKFDIGTIITISNLRYTSEELDPSEIKTTLLSLTSPYLELMPQSDEDKAIYLGKDKESLQSSEFSVELLGDFNEELSTDDNDTKTFSSSSVLANYVWRLELKLHHNQLKVELKKLDYDDAKEKWITRIVFKKSYAVEHSIGSTIYADIRFFPQRKGTFSGLGIDGRRARTWLKDNKSIAIFDHSFRISPYGEKDDDWLSLDADRARSLRHWQSPLMLKEFPMSNEQKNRTDLNPMLYIPTSNQIIGAVFVNSPINPETKNLQPSTDRMGYLDTQGFRELKDFVRFGMELIAYFDKERDLEIKMKEIEEINIKTREDIYGALEEIKSSTTMSMEDKRHMLTVYEYLSENIEDIDDYNRKSRESLQAMSLLGVVAAFMTHEYEGTLYELGSLLTDLKKIENPSESVILSMNKLKEYNSNFKDYMSYTTQFVHNLNSPSKPKPSPVVPRIEYVLNSFKKYRRELDIKVDYSSIPSDLMTPAIPVAMYDGLIHNLYSNSLKALTTFSSENKIIKFVALNESKKHIIFVMDNGPGIPEKLKARIWDPLFSTTTSKENPLGTGMGIGLPMVKKTLETIGGSITLEAAPKGFNTCFKIQIPIKD